MGVSLPHQQRLSYERVKHLVWQVHPCASFRPTFHSIKSFRNRVDCFRSIYLELTPLPISFKPSSSFEVEVSSLVLQVAASS